MLTITDEAKTAYKANTRTLTSRITIEFLGAGVTKVFTGSDIVSYTTNSESEISDGTTIPTGNISYSTLNLSLMNKDRYFDANNLNSPIYGFSTLGSIVTVEIAILVSSVYEYVEIFKGLSESFNATDKSSTVNATCNDRLKTLEDTEINPKQVYINQTADVLFKMILDDASVPTAKYSIDTILSESKYIIPIYFINSYTHLDELRALSEACSTSIYVENDIIKIDSVETLRQKYETQETYTISDYTDKDNAPNYDFIYNQVRTCYNSFIAQSSSTVYSTFTLDKEQIPVGSTELTFSLNDNTCFNHSLTTVSLPAGVTVTNEDYYSDRALITFNNINATLQEVMIDIDAETYLQGSVTDRSISECNN